MPILHINGTQLHYDLHGHGEPLLFIHGLGSCSEDWEHQVAEFARDFRVITFDLRGHGRSPRASEPCSMSMFAADAAAVLRHLQVASAHVVGVSLGGGIAFQLALDAPDLVKTLVIVNSGPEAVFRTVEQRLLLATRYAMVWLLGLSRMGQAMADKLFPGVDQGPARAIFVERFRRNDRGAYLAAMRAFVGWSVLARIGTIACPTLVIAADQDYTPVAAKAAYVGQMPHAELVVVPDARHALPMEHPARFNAVLRRFLEAHR